MIRMKRLLLTICSLLLVLIAGAQSGSSGMGELMRSNGRIYVVVGVILIILAGLLLYVYRLDRKITKLENDKN